MSFGVNGEVVVNKSVARKKFLSSSVRVCVCVCVCVCVRSQKNKVVMA
jgi:hypothetical protein